MKKLAQRTRLVSVWAMRKGRYRKNFLAEDQCPEFARKFLPELAAPLARFSNQEISAAEFVAEYLLRALCLLKPGQWKGARLEAGEPHSGLDHFRVYSFRGVPISANRSLLSWQAGLYNLELFFDVPDTQTVLQLQSRGIRCVTCLTQAHELNQYVMGERDPVSFTLHDLIHADHFLVEPHQRQVQVGFTRWLLELYSQPALRSVLTSNTAFAGQFEYACADMNSHGAHLVKYLKAVFCLSRFEELLMELSSGSQVSACFQDSLRALNTPMETPQHFQILQSELFLKGSAGRQNQEDNSIRL